MKTFLKMVLLSAVVWWFAQVWPLAFIPAGAAVAAGLAAGVGLLVGALFVGGAGVGVVAVAMGVLLLLAVVLTPVWLPVLALVGFIAVVRRVSRPAVRRA